MSEFGGPIANKGLDRLLILLVGCVTPLLVSGVWLLGGKWVLFTVLALALLALAVILPERHRFSFFLFFFICALVVRIDFYPVYLASDIYRPVNGLGINLFDLPLIFLLAGWFIRLAVDPLLTVRFFPLITLPFLAAWALTIISELSSPLPPVIQYATIWLSFESWLIFIYVANNIRDRKTVRLVITAMIVTVLIQVGVGFIQKAAGGLLGLGMFGEAEQSYFQVMAGSGIINRVGGTLGSPNKLAGYLGFILPLLIALLFSSLGSGYKKLLLWPGFILGLILDLLTFSRGGWLGLGLGGFLAFYWCLARHTGRKAGSLLGLAFLGILLIVGLLVGSAAVRNRLFSEDYGAALSRLPMSQVAVNVIRHHPWSGVGLGYYPFAAKAYDETRIAISYEFPWPVHNEYLLIAAEQGIPVLALYGLILVTVLVQLFRVGRSRDDPLLPYVAIGLFCGLLAWCGHHFFEFYHSFIKADFWFYIGLIQALVNLHWERGTTPEIEG